MRIDSGSTARLRWQAVFASISLHVLVAIGLIAAWPKPSLLTTRNVVPIEITFLELPSLLNEPPPELMPERQRSDVANAYEPQATPAAEQDQVSISRPNADEPLDIHQIDERDAGHASIPIADPTNSVQRALAKKFCDRLSELQKVQTGCEAIEFVELPVHLIPFPEEQPDAKSDNIQAIWGEKLTLSVGSSAFEDFLSENDTDPNTLPTSCLPNERPPCGIDNKVFQKRRRDSTADSERILRGQQPSWEKELRRSSD